MERFEEPGRAAKPFFITWDDPSIRPDKVLCSLGMQNLQHKPIKPAILFPVAQQDVQH